MNINEIKRMQQLAGLNEEVKPNTNAPSDVKALDKAQQSTTSVQSRAKAIDNINELPGAFESWFKTLGFQPGKLSKSAIRSSIEKALDNLGYK